MKTLERRYVSSRRRTVSKNLTVHHDRIKYLIEDTLDNRALRGQKIMIYEYPDGAICLYSNGKKLKFRKLFDRVGPAVQGEVVESERLAAALDYIKIDQEKRVMQRSSSSLRKQHLGIAPPKKRMKAA